MSQHVGPLVLIDGHNTFIRNYVRSPYMDSNGQRAGGLTGMIVSVRKIINDFHPSNVLVVWDGEGGSQKRRSIYSEYKAGRKVRLNQEYEFGESAEELIENMKRQRSSSAEILTLLGVPQARADAVEADDLIAYVAGKMDHPGGVIIVSTDQDFLQLIKSAANWGGQPDCVGGVQHAPREGEDPNVCSICGETRDSEVRVYSPVKKVMYDHKKFVSDFDVLPENFRLVKALTGDNSDNIEGIKGFGVKTIAKSFPFLKERKVSADEILAAAEGLGGVLGKRLEEEKSRFLENLRLMDLSDPMLSATAARIARENLRRDLGCKEVDFRMRVMKEGISFSGNDFTGTFRDFVLRRRRLLSSTPAPADEQVDEGEIVQQLPDVVEGGE